MVLIPSVVGGDCRSWVEDAIPPFVFSGISLIGKNDKYVPFGENHGPFLSV
jgi:hypothetical protein